MSLLWEDAQGIECIVNIESPRKGFKRMGRVAELIYPVISIHSIFLITFKFYLGTYKKESN